MEIGIKYCGGCRSLYNRKNLVDKITNYYKQYTFENVKEYKFYDYIIVVNGCSIKCADISKYYVRNKFIYIENENYKLFEDCLI